MKDVEDDLKEYRAMALGASIDPDRKYKIGEFVIYKIGDKRYKWRYWDWMGMICYEDIRVYESFKEASIRGEKFMEYFFS